MRLCSRSRKNRPPDSLPVDWTDKRGHRLAMAFKSRVFRSALLQPENAVGWSPLVEDRFGHAFKTRGYPSCRHFLVHHEECYLIGPPSEFPFFRKCGEVAADAVEIFTSARCRIQDH